MAEKLLFLTGHLAEERLAATIAGLELAEGSWRIANIGIKVAALMTEAIVKHRLKTPLAADRVIIPGRARMDLESLRSHYGVPFERGPDEIVDLPQYFGKGGRPPDLSRHDMRIFAEIVEAPTLTVEALVARARKHRAAGADVIDIGCQPDVAYPHLEETVAALKREGFAVSVDSGNVEELSRGARAGADYVLSLDETTLDAIAGTKCVPILISRPHGDLGSLVRAIDKAKSKGIPHIADPVLDPIHFGFITSLERYAELRRLKPDVEILMGTGNLTELTDADSQGVTATILGICSELHIRNLLIVQVSPHTRRTVEEHDAARRLMFRAREDASLPKGYGGGLLSLHELKPYPQTPEQIQAAAAGIRDRNYRIEAAEDGIHIYNRDGHHVAGDPFTLFPKLGVDADGAHAFYLGYELAKAEIARSLGKRYAQDNPLDWGVAADKKSEDLTRHAPEGSTLQAAKDLKQGPQKTRLRGRPEMPRIAETIVTTIDGDGTPHIAPLGLIEDGEGWIIAPFRPSRTLDNLRAVPLAVANHTQDVRVFAGCVTGRKSWPTVAADKVRGVRLADAVSHWELAVERVTEDEQRPRFHCRVVHSASDAPWDGFNRAQGAVLELAVLTTRLNMLAPEKIEAELKYLEIAISKTAGSRELEAWGWLMEKIEAWRRK